MIQLKRRYEAGNPTVGVRVLVDLCSRGDSEE